MSDISEYTPAQQKVIKEIVANDRGFHTTYMIADLPFYGMMGEADNGEMVVKKNVQCSLSAGSTDYELNIFYCVEEDCWFYNLTYLGEEVRGIIHYNTVFNARGELSFAILNDNINDKDITSSLPYSNVLIMRK